MAKIGRVSNFNCVSVDLYMTDREYDMLEGYRARTENWMKQSPKVVSADDIKFTLDDAIIYIVCEVLAGRGKYIDLNHAFND